LTDDAANLRLAVGGVELNVQRSGRGEASLFLNGTNSSIATSGPLLHRLRSMGELVVHDHRGMGESSSPEGPWSMLDYARDALGVMDELGIERFNVLGISFGGMVAQELALLVPERIRRLVLWSTSAGGGAGSSFPLDTLATMGDEERDAMALRLLDGRFDAAWLAEHPRDRRLAESRGPVPAASSTAAAAEQLEARSRHDTAERLHRLADVAVFVGAGRYDVMAPPSNAQALALLAKAERFELYEGGHLFFFQDPRAFEDLADFLR
jgi:pimeloyl-ACP methyl ester carboxylesterase